MSLNEITYMNWREIIKPEKVQIASQTPTYGKFVWEPLERGFGITIGNSLRRIILSSICGSAIVSVKFDGVMHEFSTIPGVLEDVSEIILNLKNVRVKMEDSEPKMIEIDAAGERVVTAADIISGDGKVEIMNLDQHIATLSADAKFRVEMSVKAGKGYALAEFNKDPEAPVGTIAIDSVFSPIKRVNYRISNARVGQKTDYDKLSMEVWTDGSVTPEDSVAFGAKILKEQMNVFINFDEELEPELTEKSADDSKPRHNENLYLDVDELELSVRSANCLRNANITKIYQLVERTEAEMLKTKNFGRKSLNEIKELLAELGLSLGMNIDSFEPPEDDDTDQGE
ncbi:MAG: DNA-directed RNA polymerase subunit alpha [Desulfobacteraceae bacterium]|nr:DNA-directed RNA polymerase subunit alpha [Desulfobacteraceae bacterium]MBC2756194.1 DNA-directed RNA polymerase subunit alpha [Desulfobacteraceae bacterium]